MSKTKQKPTRVKVEVEKWNGGGKDNVLKETWFRAVVTGTLGEQAATGYGFSTRPQEAYRLAVSDMWEQMECTEPTWQEDEVFGVEEDDEEED